MVVSKGLKHFIALRPRSQIGVNSWGCSFLVFTHAQMTLIDTIQDFLGNLDMKPRTYAAIGNHHFFIIKDLFKASIYLDSIYVPAF
jgi:hypothetical protein